MTDKVKKVVQYRASDAFIQGVDGYASVFAYQHPDALYVEPGTDARVTTSRIVAFDADSGEFETLNTKYVPK